MHLIAAPSAGFRLSPAIAAQSSHVHPALRRHTVGAEAGAGAGDALTAGDLAGGELATPFIAGESLTAGAGLGAGEALGGAPAVLAALLEAVDLVLLGGFFAPGVLAGVFAGVLFVWASFSGCCCCASFSLSSFALGASLWETAASVSPAIAAQSSHVHPALRRHTVGAEAGAGAGDALTAGDLAGGELATPLDTGEACTSGAVTSATEEGCSSSTTSSVC